MQIRIHTTCVGNELLRKTMSASTGLPFVYPPDILLQCMDIRNLVRVQHGEDHKAVYSHRNPVVQEVPSCMFLDDVQLKLCVRHDDLLPYARLLQFWANLHVEMDVVL